MTETTTGGSTIATPDGVVIAEQRHIDLTATHPTPSDFDLEAHVLDHAGSYYDWFWSAYIRDTGHLVIKVSPDSIEYLVEADYSTNADTREFTRDQVWAAVVKMHEDDKANGVTTTYGGQYATDLIARNWDDLDGDMNIIDELLQRLAFGEIVFG